MKVAVPPGQLGPWTVEQFMVTQRDEEYSRLRTHLGHAGEYVPAGQYTRLLRDRTVVMSDTPTEWDDLAEVLRRAAQARTMLVHGLGLGLVLTGVAHLPVEVTVVELDPRVLRLVGPHYQALLGPRLHLVQGDALTWPVPRGTQWDVAWHDIWDNVCRDNLPAMRTLCRRFGRRVGWQGCWARDRLPAR